LVVLSAAVVALVVGSIVEIGAQSASYRQTVGQGYGALASRIVDASNQTGAALAKLVDQAPTLASSRPPLTARSQVQAGLDQAVTAADAEATQARQLAPPSPGDIAARFTQVLDDRATAVVDLRSTIDHLLEMSPIPVAGNQAASTRSSGVPTLISVQDAAQQLGNVGAQLQQVDREYASLAAQMRHGRGTGAGSIRLPSSVWVPAAHPVLGATALGGTAEALSQSNALAVVQQVTITAVGIDPPAVPSAGSGTLGVSCQHPSPTASGTSPSSTAVLPPTGTVVARITVTNCGSIVEPGVVVAESLALVPQPGVAPPPAATSGSHASRGIPSLLPGSSTGVTLPALRVAKGHLYSLTLWVTVPQGPQDAPGMVQVFRLQISG
jgi:hypothetical protein